MSRRALPGGRAWRRHRVIESARQQWEDGLRRLAEAAAMMPDYRRTLRPARGRAGPRPPGGGGEEASAMTEVVIEFLCTFMLYRRGAPEAASVFPGVKNEWTVG